MKLTKSLKIDFELTSDKLKPGNEEEYADILNNIIGAVIREAECQLGDPDNQMVYIGYDEVSIVDLSHETIIGPIILSG